MKWIKFDIKKHSEDLPKQGTVLVAPLHWGLGHATRCVPIIKQLLEQKYQVILASDGQAGQYLQKTFPNLKYYELPGYQVTYSQNSRFFLLWMAIQIPKFFRTMKREMKMIDQIVGREGINCIISDNRFGAHHPQTKNIYITHQLKVRAGIFSGLAKFIHQRIIQKHDVCWVPDMPESPLSGKLSQLNAFKIPLRYIGLLSALNIPQLPEIYDVLILLSGPEPWRRFLERDLIKALKNSKIKITLVQGLISDKKEKQVLENITIVSFLKGEELAKTIAQSKIIITRSGYSSIMDLLPVHKKLLLIPTPGQTEQEYLASYLSEYEHINVISQKNIGSIPKLLSKLLE
jgi:predicted glycosyltransferase